jgi:maleate cis-trans isomerase
MAISSSWRGSVGIIKPTMRLGGIEEFIRLLPEGIGVLPLYVNIRKGTEEEFKSVLDHFEEKVKALAEVPVELIHPEGAPPFMVHGFAGEREIVKRWEREYGVPIVTAPQTQVEAMRALGIRRIVGVSYFPGEINETFAKYFRDAGIEVLAMVGMDVQFDRVQNLSSHEVYAHTRKAFLEHPGADGIYMLGSGWKCTDILQMMEDDFRVPVVHAQTARIWAIQNRLNVREPRTGYGRLLAEFPPPVEVALAH